MRLRALRWWDVAELMPIERELFPYNVWPAEAFWAELALGHRRTFLVAQADDGTLVGYAGLSCPPDARGGDAEVMTVAVAPVAQGRGLGRQLVEALLGEAGRRGAGRVMLEVRSDNAAARALYQRLGFEQVGERPAYYSGGPGGPGGAGAAVDALVMRLRLPVADTVPQ